tara:strand:- start:2893 stop:4161 length:1269 start_codon:yes stop_codon:yes gene_type:complete
MRYTDLANAWERSRLGDRSLSALQFKDKATAMQAYEVLFPKVTLTERKVLSKVAIELQVPYKLLLELLDRRVSLLLASESSASNPCSWSLEDILKTRDAVIEGDYSFLALSKQMSETDAKLFWSSTIGEQYPISILKFLKNLDRDISPDIIASSRGFLTDKEIINAVYTDKNLLYNPRLWYQKPTAALRKRRWIPWSKHKSVDIEVYQSIPNNGIVSVEYNEDENIIIERAGTVITDVAYPKHPQLSLKERLSKYAETHNDELAWPMTTPSWDAIIKQEDTVRFPNTGAFSPTEYGGYVLVKQSHIHNLRLASYRQGDELEIKLEAIDGIDEFVSVGFCTVYILSEKSSIAFDIERILGSNTEEVNRWKDIPEDVCIVIRVSSPFVDRRTNTLSDASFVEIDNDMGISDVAQYVDLVGVGNE